MALVRCSFKSQETRGHRNVNGFQLTGTGAAVRGFAENVQAGMSARLSRVATLTRSGDFGDTHAVGSGVSARIELLNGRAYGKMTLQDVEGDDPAGDLVTALTSHIKIGRFGPLATAVNVKLHDNKTD